MSERMEGRVFEVGMSLVAAGLYPSLDRLAAEIGGSVYLIVSARRSLVSRGLWPVEVKNPAPIPAEDGEARRRTRRRRGQDGLDGRTPAEVRRLERNARKIRGEHFATAVLPVVDHGFSFRELTNYAACRCYVRMYRRAIGATT